MEVEKGTLPACLADCDDKPASNVHVITTDGGEHLSVDQLRADAAGVSGLLAREHGRATAKLTTRAQSPARKRRLRARLARLEGDAKRVQGYQAALDQLEEGLSFKPTETRPAPASEVSDGPFFDAGEDR